MNKKPNGYWTLERCKDDALKYKSKIEWSIKSISGYNAAIKHKWMDVCCGHMIQLSKVYSLEECKAIALNYSSRVEWKIQSYNSYRKALKNKWINLCCNHMPIIKQANGYWTFEKCKEEGLKYKTSTEWAKKSGSSWCSALKNGWLKECCVHMEIKGSKYKRLIYGFEFPDNYVYIGLTSNIKNRTDSHLTSDSSQVYKHIKKSGLKPKLVELTQYVDAVIAKNLEGEILNDYKLMGWNILNKAKTGNLGGGGLLKWTLEMCKKEAIKYKTRTEWSINSNGSYQFARKNGWFNLCTEHMIRTRNHSGYWTFEKCKEEALKYNRKVDFQNKSKGSYLAALRKGWLKDICLHMSIINKPKGYWTFEKCKEEALKYNRKVDFQKQSGSAYNKSFKFGWLFDISKHMINKNDLVLANGK